MSLEAVIVALNSLTDEIRQLRLTILSTRTTQANVEALNVTTINASTPCSPSFTRGIDPIVIPPTPVAQSNANPIITGAASVDQSTSISIPRSNLSTAISPDISSGSITSITSVAATTIPITSTAPSEVQSTPDNDTTSNLTAINYIDNTWYPIKLHGKIESRARGYAYVFCRSVTLFTTYNEALEYQLIESLKNARNNKFVIKREAPGLPGVVFLMLRDDTHAILDFSDLPLIREHVFYHHKGHVITRINEDRTRMCEIILGCKVRYRNGNTLDNRRCNLDTSTASTASAPVTIPNGITTANDAETDDTTTDENTNHLVFPEITTPIWEKLLSHNDVSTVAIYLSSLSSRYTSFPLPSYTDKDLITDFDKVLSYQHHTISVTAASSCGGKIALHFVGDVLFTAYKKGYATIAEVWNDPVKRLRLWTAMIKLKMPSATKSSLVRAYALKFYKVGNFPATVARNLYDHYFLPTINNKRVLDFCAGWSGRMIGFYASKTCNEYIGIDPNTQLHSRYPKIVEWITTNYEHTRYKQVKTICAAAEDVDYTSLGMFDIVFTSPPYFDLEIYCNEPTQSYSRYPQLEVWRDKFLFATLAKIIPVIKPGGVLAINIKQSNEWAVDICGQMCQFLVAAGMKQSETLSLLLSKRPSSKKDSDAPSEPIFVFTK